MSSGISFDVKGLSTLILRLEAMSAMAPQLAQDILQREGNNILNDANNRYVPIETQELRDTGKVSPVTVTPTGYSVTISYGGDGSRVDEYAIAVHEHPSSSSPPSWLGKSAGQIKWTKPGTGVKYLLNALSNNVAGLLSRMSDRYKAFLGRHKV